MTFWGTLVFGTVVVCERSACFPSSWCICQWKEAENAHLQLNAWPKEDWTWQSHMRTVLYLGVIGLHRTNSTLPQQPRVKGFSPPWNFLFICNENFSTSAALDFWPITWSCYSLGSHYDLKFQVFWWTITHFPRLTCSFVVRPVATRTIWKHANPITGMKKRPDMLMMDKLTQCCQGATRITGEMIQTELTNNY